MNIIGTSRDIHLNRKICVKGDNATACAKLDNPQLYAHCALRTKIYIFPEYLWKTSRDIKLRLEIYLKDHSATSYARMDNSELYFWHNSVPFPLRKTPKINIYL